MAEATWESAPMAQRRMVSGKVPPPLVFVGKIVLEVLPAALASLIGGVLFAHYQFGQPATPTPPAAGPASAEMVRLIGEEHAMIRDFMVAQQAAENRQIAAANRDGAQPVMAVKMLEAAKGRVAAETATAKPPLLQSKPVIVAAAMLAPPPPRPVVAQVDPYRLDAYQVLPPVEVSAPVAAPAPAHPSIVATTLAIPRRAVSVTLHAVGAIGSIPSWLGHRFGDGSAVAVPFSTAS